MGVDTHEAARRGQQRKQKPLDPYLKFEHRAARRRPAEGWTMRSPKQNGRPKATERYYTPTKIITPTALKPVRAKERPRGWLRGALARGRR